MFAAPSSPSTTPAGRPHRRPSTALAVALAGLLLVGTAPPAAANWRGEPHPPVTAAVTTAPNAVDLAALGAVPDDGRDDAVALQAALDAASDGAVALAAGVYELSRPLLLPSGIDLSGAGAETVLAFDWFASADGSAYVRDASDGGGRDEAITVRDLTIRGPHDGTPWGPSPAPAVALRLRRVDRAEVRGVRFTGVPGIAAAFQGGQGGRFVDNVVADSGRDGFYGSAFVDPLRDLLVSGNRFDRIGDDGVAIHRHASAWEPQTAVTEHVTVRDNIIRGHERVYASGAGRGVLVRDSRDVVVADNDIASTFASGIHVSGVPDAPAQRIALVGNTVRAAGAAGDGSQPAAGVWLAHVADVSVRGNAIFDAADHGVYARGASGLVVSGNTVTVSGTDARHAGIDFDGAQAPVDRIVASDNTISRSAGPGVRLWQTGAASLVRNRVSDGNTAVATDPLQTSGIVVHTDAPVTVAANTSTGARQPFGIYLGWRASRVRVAGNRVSGNAIDGVGGTVRPAGSAVAAGTLRASLRAAGTTVSR